MGEPIELRVQHYNNFGTFFVVDDRPRLWSLTAQEQTVQRPLVTSWFG